MSDQDDIKLRDQLAIAAMQALLTQYKQQSSISETGSRNTMGSEYSRSETSQNNFYKYEIETDVLYICRIQTKMEMIADLSYQIADAMRKSRLKSFT